MWVIETLVDGEALSWELSKPVPRNAAGEPVESGPLEPGGASFVVGERDTFDTMIAFLKERSDVHVRVGRIELAWAAAERRGSARERTILRDGTRPPSPQPVHTPGAARRSARGPSSPLTGVIVLLVLAAFIYFVLQLL